MSDPNAPQVDSAAAEQDDRSHVAQEILDYLDSVKEKLAADFERLGLGKDMLLRVHDALDVAHATVASARPVEGHDLNVDLAENPEDHPAPQGQQPTPINTDDNVNQASPEAPAQPVISGAPQDAPAPAAVPADPAVQPARPAEGDAPASPAV